jgi:A/G-specific adenine glycosylase
MAPQKAIVNNLLEWYRKHSRDLPWRKTTDPYAIFVSEMMLHQTQVNRVVPKYIEFLNEFPTLKSLADATPGAVIKAWAGLGYNRRALWIHTAAKDIVSRFKGRIPSDTSELEALNGIGKYTASAIACFAFKKPVPVIDTNIRRVIGRLFFDETLPREHAIHIIATSMLEVIPNKYASEWNQGLMDLGALICKPSMPQCPQCPMIGSCAYYLQLHSSSKQNKNWRAPKTLREPFKGSRRYYRGRIIQHLRALPLGTSTDLQTLKGRLAREAELLTTPSIYDLILMLRDEGLIIINEHTANTKANLVRVRLP